MRLWGARAGRRAGPYVSGHPRYQQREATIEWLASLGLVREVALIARVFRQDPIMLLDDDGDEFPHLVRLAAARFVARQEESAARKASAH